MKGCPPFVFIVELFDMVSASVRSTLIIKINHWRYLMVHGFEHQTEEIQIKQGRWLRTTTPSLVVSDKNLMVEDFIHIKRVDPCLNAKGKEVIEGNKKVDINSGDVTTYLNAVWELTISSNLN